MERIFRLCDINHNGYLDNEELKVIQDTVFSFGITNEDINLIREFILTEVCFVIRVV